MKELFLCTICNKELKSKKALDIHMSKSHKEEFKKLKDQGKSFVCLVCNKKFKDQRGLDTHMGRSHKESCLEKKQELLKEKQKDNNIQCPYCEQKFSSINSLLKHTIRTHKISSEQTIIDYKHNGIQPLCKCGCGNKTKYHSGISDFNEYLKGHIARVKNNYQTEKSITNSRKTKAERATLNVYKGILKTEEHKEKIRQKSLLHRHTDESKEKMSEEKKQWLKDNPDKADYYNNQFWKDYWKDPVHRFEQGVRQSFLSLENYKNKKQLEIKTEKEGYVYLIQIEGRDYYKIGYTNKTPYDRLGNLQQSTPDKLFLVDYFKTKHKMKLEKMMHEKFKEKRIVKEWFGLSQEDIGSFKNYCENFEKILDS